LGEIENERKNDWFKKNKIGKSYILW
jgi:hypothetical protein